MPRYRCVRCGPPPAGLEWGGKPECPKCGRSGMPHVFELCDVHLMVMDDRGPITGAEGRQFIACEPRREHLALIGGDGFAASGDVRAVTCAACKRTKHFRRGIRQFPQVLAEEAQRRAGGRLLDTKG